MKRLLTFGTLMVFVSGCAGGGTSLPSARHLSQNGQVSLTLTIPRANADALRKAESISPSTQSIGIKVNSAAEQFFNATATSPGCSSDSAGTTCTFNVTAPAGNDTFVVTAYSGTNGGGAVLDTATVSASVTAAPTPVNVTLGAVVSTTADTGPGSLRQAIADANAGDTIGFVVSTPATITVTKPIAISKNITLSGSSSGTVTISGGNASQIFTVASGTSVAIDGLTLTQGSSPAANGGAIDDSGTLTLTSVQITNSTAGLSGTTGIRRDTLKGVTPPKPPRTRQTPPLSYNGGAVAVENGGSLSVTNGTFSGDTAYQGGAIWTDSSSSTGPTLSIGGSTFSNDATTYTGGSCGNDSGYGGAIYNSIPATLTNDTFTGNDGSAVSVWADTTISGGTFSGNKAGGYCSVGYGGAIYAEGPVTITNATFSNNIAGSPTTQYAFGYGGAIYSDYDLSVTGSTFSGNQAGTANNAYGYGGAIDMNDGNLTVGSSTFTSNTAGATGYVAGATTGPSYAYGGAISDETGNTASITGSTFTGNLAGGTGYGFGGALDLAVQLTFDRNTFTSNEAFGTDYADTGNGYAYGGAVYQNNGGSGNMTNSTFTSNSALGDDTTDSGGYAYGGAVDTEGGSNDFSGDTFASNTVSGASQAYGGGLSNDGATVTMTGGSFTGNTAAQGLDICANYAEGGGIYANSDTTLTGVSVTNNSATVAGLAGGACSGIRVTFPPNHRAAPTHSHRVRNGAPSGYPEYSYGGGIEADNGNLTLSGVTVTGNTSATDAGGIASFSSGTVQISNSTISSNSITNAPGNLDGGGGLWLAASLGSTITGSTISGNTIASSANADVGGGVYVDQFAATFTNDTITGNSAATGGDVYSSAAQITLTNVTLVNGTATASNGQGGDFYGGGGSLTLFGSIIAGGTASTQNNLGGTFTLTDHGYNIINTSNGSLGGASDFDNQSPTIDPLLSALANNGGTTQTMADGSTSPGKDFIPFSKCIAQNVTVDQRGYGRNDSSDTSPSCDAGAYEFNAVVITPT